jgi:hypothetical protein
MVVDVLTFVALVVLYVAYDRHAMRSAPRERGRGRRLPHRAKVVRLRVEDVPRRRRAARSRVAGTRPVA